MLSSALVAAATFSISLVLQGCGSDGGGGPVGTNWTAVPDVIIEGGEYKFSFVRKHSVPGPAFAEMSPVWPGKLVLTCFGERGLQDKAAVYMLDTTKPPDEAELEKLPGTSKLMWPNKPVGTDTFGFPGIVIGEGFLVPTKTVGGIWILEASTTPTVLKKPVKITTNKKGFLGGWFYHDAHLFDVNGDGLLDIVTARTQWSRGWGTFWRESRGEMIWLEHPQSNGSGPMEALSGKKWEEHHVVDGPDFHFLWVPGSDKFEFFATHFVTEKVVYYWRAEDGTMKNRIIDDTCGPAFSASWVDLNSDGRLELMVSNHKQVGGSVYAYQFDCTQCDYSDPENSKVTRHELAGGFNAVMTSGPASIPGVIPRQASPGDAVAFQLGAGKPHIIVSGDGTFDVSLLIPKSQDANNFEYTKQQIVNVLDGVVGRPAVGDTDGDGFADVYIPAWANNELLHLKFSPADGSRRLDAVVV